MTAPNLPQVGAAYEFDGQRGTVKEVRKRGRGYQVVFDVPQSECSGILVHARLADWNKGAVAA